MKNISIKLYKKSDRISFPLKRFFSHQLFCLKRTFSSCWNILFYLRVINTHTRSRTKSCFSTWKNIFFFLTNKTMDNSSFFYVKRYFSRFSKSSKLIFYRMFLPQMNATRRVDNKVFKSVIMSNMIYMMNHFFSREKSFQIFFNNKSVFQIISIFSTIRMIFNFPINIAFLACLRDIRIVFQGGDVQCLHN